MNTSKPDLHQQVTDRIIAHLEKGVVPWRKPWGFELPPKINTRQYYYLYNCRPAGIRYWRFAIGSREVSFLGSYQKATRQAREIARNNEVTIVYLLY